MSENSRIEWTDATWNPVRGCTKIAPGCANCYAETFAERFRGVEDHPYQQGFDLRLVPEKLTEPFRWPTPRRVFVNSMSDLFHEKVPDEYVEAVVKVMAAADWHTYQVLTKRSNRMKRLLQTKLRQYGSLDHIWWGVSAEDRKHGKPRVRELQATPVAVRFLSVEPLLEDIGRLPLKGIHWVIVGGESGPRARPMDESWVNKIQAQCARAEVPFFFKQWGGVQKRRTGRMLNGRTYDEFPSTQIRKAPSLDDRRKTMSRFNPLVQLQVAV